MKIYLGIDCNNKRTEVTIIDESENILYEHTSPPSPTYSIDSNKILESCQKSLSYFLHQHPEYRFATIYAGGQNLTRPGEFSRMESILKRLPLVDENTVIKVTNNAVNYLYSGKLFESGIALVCDIDMVVYGQNGNKTYTHVNTHHSEGDPGSACYMGGEAIHYVMRLIEHNEDLNEFSTSIKDQVPIRGVEDFEWIAENFCGNCDNTAKIAETVLKYADEGDQIAIGFVDEAIDTLVNAVKIASKEINYKSGNVVVIGMLETLGVYFQKKLHRRLLELNQNFDIINATVSPSLGAALAAKYKM